MPTAGKRADQLASIAPKVNPARLLEAGIKLEDLLEDQPGPQDVPNEIDELEEHLVFMKDDVKPMWVYTRFRLDLLAVKDDENEEALKYIYMLDTVHRRNAKKDPTFKRPAQLPSQNVIKGIRACLQPGAAKQEGDHQCQQCQRFAKKRKVARKGDFALGCWAVPGQHRKCSACIRRPQECSFDKEFFKPTFAWSKPEDIDAVKTALATNELLIGALPPSEIKEQLVNNAAMLKELMEKIGDIGRPNMGVGGA